MPQMGQRDPMRCRHVLVEQVHGSEHLRRPGDVCDADGTGLRAERLRGQRLPKELQYDRRLHLGQLLRRYEDVRAAQELGRGVR